MKTLTTVRLDPEDYRAIVTLSRRQGLKKSEAIRQTIHYGLIYLLNGENEEELVQRRLSQKVTDIDGATFLAQLKKELKI